MMKGNKDLFTFVKKVTCRLSKYLFFIFSLCLFLTLSYNSGVESAITSPFTVTRKGAHAVGDVFKDTAYVLHDFFTESEEERIEREAREYREAREPKSEKHAQSFSGHGRRTLLHTFEYALYNVHISVSVSILTDEYGTPDTGNNNYKIDILEIAFFLTYVNESDVDTRVPVKFKMRYTTSGVYANGHADGDIDTNLYRYGEYSFSLDKEGSNNSNNAQGLDTWSKHDDVSHSSIWLTDDTVKRGFTQIRGLHNYDCHIRSDFLRIESISFYYDDIHPYVYKTEYYVSL